MYNRSTLYPVCSLSRAETCPLTVMVCEYILEHNREIVNKKTILLISLSFQ
jgi:hypothetical protein